MKKWLCAAFALVTILLIAGCAESSLIENSPMQAVEEIDIDLVRMGPTMVSAQVFWIMLSPEDYLGQVIRIMGSYYAFYWEEGEMQLHYIVLDLTAGCCGQAFEFKLPAHIVDAVGYPSEGSVIEIVGVFSSYEMWDNVFYYLAVREIIVH